MPCYSGSRVSSDNWLATVRNTVARFGHRNWIVVADSAFPVHVAEGVQTILADADPVDVLRSVLQCIATARHVSGTAYLDAELAAVSEERAPGVSGYREHLRALLLPYEQVTAPHEEMLAKLAEAARTFSVLVVKTRLRIPYTSVFIHLGCGYWSEEAESELRASLFSVR